MNCVSVGLTLQNSIILRMVNSRPVLWHLNTLVIESDEFVRAELSEQSEVCSWIVAMWGELTSNGQAAGRLLGFAAGRSGDRAESWRLHRPGALCERFRWTLQGPGGGRACVFRHCDRVRWGHRNFQHLRILAARAGQGCGESAGVVLEFPFVFRQEDRSTSTSICSVVEGIICTMPGWVWCQILLELVQRFWIMCVCVCVCMLAEFSNSACVQRH